MKIEQIKNEFRSYKLTDKMAEEIALIYKSIANLCAEASGGEVTNSPVAIKFVMNITKSTVIAVLESYNVRKN